MVFGANDSGYREDLPVFICGQTSQIDNLSRDLVFPPVQNDDDFRPEPLPGVNLDHDRYRTVIHFYQAARRIDADTLDKLDHQIRIQMRA